MSRHPSQWGANWKPRRYVNREDALILAWCDHVIRIDDAARAVKREARNAKKRKRPQQ